jgi:hypothetical protein
MDEIISSAEETPEEDSLTRDDVAETGEFVGSTSEVSYTMDLGCEFLVDASSTDLSIQLVQAQRQPLLPLCQFES